MKTNIILFLRLFLLGCIIPIIMSTVVYMGFSTNYTVGVFSKPDFEHFYKNGIYKYRIVSTPLLLKTYDLIKQYGLPTIEPRSLSLIDNNGDPQFYSAYFYMNTFFLCLTSILLLIILGGHRKEADFMMIDLPVLFLCSLMTITQYVVVPYDTLSYFLLSMAAILIFSENRTSWHLLVLCIVVILATLTRETAAFILAFYFAVNYKTILTRPILFKMNPQQREFLLITICFLGTYVGLRVTFGYTHAIYQSFWFSTNINLPSAILGMLFFASMALSIISTTTVTKEISVFFLITFPYVVFIFLFAEPWEIRLWIPILLPLIIMKVRASQSLVIQNPLPKTPHL
jgi:hypothetical protein